MKKMQQRIAKRLARIGIASRRDIEKMITEKRIRVNGKILTEPVCLVSDEDQILIDEKPIKDVQATRVWKYHKPTGLLTTHKDTDNRRTVFSELPTSLPRLISIGRLDMNSEGLLLLTNDGELAHILEHPKTGWQRQYRVRVYGYVSQRKLDFMRNGMTIEGIHYQPAEVEIELAKGLNTWLKIKIKEGKNREIRRMLMVLELKISKLIRTDYGPFSLNDLGKSKLEEINKTELYNACHDLYPELEAIKQVKTEIRQDKTVSKGQHKNNKFQSSDKYSEKTGRKKNAFKPVTKGNKANARKRSYLKEQQKETHSDVKKTTNNKRPVLSIKNKKTTTVKN